MEPALARPKELGLLSLAPIIPIIELILDTVDKKHCSTEPSMKHNIFITKFKKSTEPLNP